MLRKVTSKVAWVGRTASMVFGLALVLALLFGLATAAVGANGDNLILGVLTNNATDTTRLNGNVSGGPALQVVNNNTAAGSRGLQVNVAQDKPPILVTATAGKATNLNADRLDGKNSADFLGKCENGTIFGRAEIDGAEATSTLSTTGVVGNSDFICNAPSENVQVERQFVGSYRVVFGDVEHDGRIGELLSGPGPKPKAMVTSRENDKIVSATGPLQCATSPPPEITCYIVEVQDSNDQLFVDGDFTIAIL